MNVLLAVVISIYVSNTKFTRLFQVSVPPTILPTLSGENIADSREYTDPPSPAQASSSVTSISMGSTGSCANNTLLIAKMSTKTKSNVFFIFISSLRICFCFFAYKLRNYQMIFSECDLHKKHPNFFLLHLLLFDLHHLSKIRHKLRIKRL